MKSWLVVNLNHLQVFPHDMEKLTLSQLFATMQIWEEKEEILMKRMINKLVYSYSSSESLLLSEQSHFYMDKAKQTKKAYDWVKLQTPGFLNIARLRPFASGYPWNKRSFSMFLAKCYAWKTKF